MLGKTEKSRKIVRSRPSAGGRIARVNFDAGSEMAALFEPGEAVRPGAQPPLGILRNRYAAGGENDPQPVDISWQSDAQKDARRADRFALQRTAASLTPELRVAHCLWTPVAVSVDVLRRGDDARFGGVQTCGSVWSCPCCSARISEVRRRELRELRAWVGQRPGLKLVMVTLTARHRGRALESLLDRLSAAKRGLQNRKAWQRLRESGQLVGTVSVREATHGENGWHPHYHVLCIVKAQDESEVLEIFEPFRMIWLDCLKKEGLGGTLERAFHLSTSEDLVAEYVSKASSDLDKTWGIAEEMTLGRLKRGRGAKGASPWQILREAHDGDDAAKVLWAEYARTMLGRRQQVWSNGLKELIGLTEIEDEEAAEGEEYSEGEDEILHSFDRPEWRRWRSKRAEILAAGRIGREALAAVLAAAADPMPPDPGGGPVHHHPRPPIPPDGIAARALAAMRAARAQVSI